MALLRRVDELTRKSVMRLSLLRMCQKARVPSNWLVPSEQRRPAGSSTRLWMPYIEGHEVTHPMTRSW
ncbi:hypothetical protein VTN31DRAFT_1665 [Thermomyces dupontii]|uniref:uncharacterized protein n=1 Tax=Talaromyces thermophilus TaxID=28565 RepID=UPI0037429F21